jgi:hypothetical protein
VTFSSNRKTTDDTIIVANASNYKDIAFVAGYAAGCVAAVADNDFVDPEMDNFGFQVGLRYAYRQIV